LNSVGGFKMRQPHCAGARIVARARKKIQLFVISFSRGIALSLELMKKSTLYGLTQFVIPVNNTNTSLLASTEYLLPTDY
jgi:hypothetical protein